METCAHFLVVVIDLNPIWWERKIASAHHADIVCAYIDAIISYCNAHVLLNSHNDLMVISICGQTTKILWPSKSIPGIKNLEDHVAISDGKLECLSEMNQVLKAEIQRLIGECDKSQCNLAPALSMGLCCINKRQFKKSHITVLKAADDSPSQYMHLMNIAFTAQKLKVIIDGIIINTESQSSLLSQVCHITGGVVINVRNIEALLQHLLCSPLVQTSLRTTLKQPLAPKLNSQVACACHRQLVQIGFVCSICLSVFCSFRPFCSTCGTLFPMPNKTKQLTIKND